METDSQFLERLKSLLLQTPFPKLDELARTFNARQLRGCLALLCLADDKRILEKSEIVVLHRRRRDLLPYAWNLLKVNYPVIRLERVVRTLAKEFGWSRVGPKERLSEKLEAWFVSPPLDFSILRDFLHSRAGNLESWLGDADIHPNSGLFLAVRRRLLLWFDKMAIDRLGHRYLLSMAEAERDETRRDFAVRYLNQLRKEDNWHPTVLQWIQGKFGLAPHQAAAQTPFWKRVDVEPRMRFRKWALERSLEEFFKDIHDPNGRFRFWRQFLDQISDVEKAADGEAALLDFGHFGVVEFAQIGNAAYVYPSVHFQKVRERAARGFYDHRALKLPSNTVQKYAWDGRIIHSGAWQHRAEARIRSLLRET